MNGNRQFLSAFGALALLLVVLGIFIVPAHWTSLWDDREFTDWITPISNELRAGARLYADGLHNPMPPLPFVLVRCLYPNHAVWIDENLLNYLFQAAMLLLMFYLLSQEFGVVVGFVSCLAAVPIIFSLQKTILYDAMAQFFVAGCAFTTSAIVRRSSSRWGLLAVLGSLLAALLLTKQSTGAGAVLGVSVVLLSAPRPMAFRQQFLNLAFAGICTLLALGVMTLAFSRFVDAQGMVRDVFINGSEPKGGAPTLLHSLRKMSFEMAFITFRFTCIVFVLYSIVTRSLNLNKFTRDLSNWFFPADATNSNKLSHSTGWLLFSTAVAIISCISLYFWLEQTGPGHDVPSLALRISKKVFDIGLMAGFFASACLIFGKLPRPAGFSTATPLAIYAVIFIFSALFHNLSVAVLRWTYDNNPLILLVLGFFFHAVLFAPSHARFAGSRWIPFAQGSIICATIVSLWFGAVMQMENIIQCTESWPEVAQLSGAKLRPQAEGMRALVKTVRFLAGPDGDSAVLLLPNDPNVQAWFDRPTPKLSSAIIFADQYWDRYVDRDFTELQAHPPKVIIIGPANFWRPFSREWKTNLGVERLIDRISADLLPKAYQLSSRQPITYRDKNDFMEVYVRRDK